MKSFDRYITLIFIIKICFAFFGISHLYLKFIHKEYTDIDKKVLYWKDIFQFIFILLMSCLLIYLFNPLIDNRAMIDKETKTLLYLFGFILIITAKWDMFFEEDQWFKDIQQILK